MAGFLIRVHQIDTYINFISGRFCKTPVKTGGREKETFLQNPDEDGGNYFGCVVVFVAKFRGPIRKKVDGHPSTRGCSAMLDPFFDFFVFLFRMGEYHV